MAKLLATLTAAHSWAVAHPEVVLPIFCTVLTFCAFAALVSIVTGEAR